MDKEFQEKFWQEKVRWKEAGDIVNEQGVEGIAVRIGGHHHLIVTKDSFFGKGQSMGIEFIDGPHKGRKIIWHNTWFQGKIPSEFQEQLPDNAIAFPWWLLPLHEKEPLEKVWNFLTPMPTYNYVNSFNMSRRDKEEFNKSREMYQFYCWLPESQFAPGDTHLFYNNMEDVPDFLHKYVEQWSKPALTTTPYTL